MKFVNGAFFWGFIVVTFQFQASLQSRLPEQLTSRSANVVGRLICYSMDGQEIRAGVRVYRNPNSGILGNSSRQPAREIITETAFESVRPISRQLESTNPEKFIQALNVCRDCMRSLRDSYTNRHDQQNIYRFQNNLFSATQYLNSKPDDDKIKFAAAAVVNLIAEESINITIFSQVENLRTIATIVADDCVISGRDSVSPSVSSDDSDLQ